MLVEVGVGAVLEFVCGSADDVLAVGWLLSGIVGLLVLGSVWPYGLSSGSLNIFKRLACTHEGICLFVLHSRSLKMGFLSPSIVM